MPTLLADAASVPLLAYGVLFFAMLIEGDIALLAGFFLVERGVLDFGTTVAVVLAGAAIAEMAWFAGGRDGGHGWVGRIVTRCAESLSRFDRHLIERPFLTLFVSKFAYGIYRLIVFRAGMLRIEARRFVKYDAPATLLWIVIVGGLGYLSGASFELFERRLRSIEIGLAVIIVVLIVAERIIARILGKRL